jgi:hypothetical protein
MIKRNEDEDDSDDTNDNSNPIYFTYSKEAVRDIIDTYGYHAYPQQEVKLTEQEKKDRLDPGWLQRNVFTYDDGEWKFDVASWISYKTQTDIGYFKRKMISLGYPKECLDVICLHSGNLY